MRLAITHTECGQVGLLLTRPARLWQHVTAGDFLLPDGAPVPLDGKPTCGNCGQPWASADLADDIERAGGYTPIQEREG